ncbi:MAG TPA: EAL domain-containing protein [Acidimicrobiales bacterium]|nr:EAL domain-containing protein [Acidimicrobiales bacterium]
MVNRERAGLSAQAWALITIATLAGVATLSAGILRAIHHAGLSASEISAAGVFTALLTLAWLRPLIIFRDGQSECAQLDEGIFVAMALVLPGWTTLLAFAAATIVAQAIQRRPLVKSAFNFGQVMLAVGAGLAVTAPFVSATGRPTPWALLGAVLGAVTYLVVNWLSVGAILTATGTTWREAMLDGVELRILLMGAGAAIGLVVALAIARRPWAAPVGVMPFVVLRQILAGHFRARHDHQRTVGLFDATLEVNRFVERNAIRAAVLDAARRLLRCDEAHLTEEPPADRLAARVPVNDTELWLSVSGRSRTEPFDDADRVLLEALAAVGTTTLTNAALNEQTRSQQQHLAAITASLGEGVCAVSRSGLITFINPAGAAMLGWELPTDEDEERIAPGFLLLPATKSIESAGQVTSYDTQFERSDGAAFPVAYTASPIPGELGPEGAVIVFRDISERKAFEEQLALHAFHDPLTGLANRRLFLDHLTHAQLRTARSGERHAVLFADVDRFKLINDGLGHHAGDQLLAAIAERIRSSLRPGDVVARFGGDEFTVLLEGVSGEADAVASAERITETLADPIILPGGHEVVASISIGIAVTRPGQSPDDVLRDADVAMYQAKRRGRVGRYALFNGAQMGVRSTSQIELEAALRRGIDRDELEVHFQPIVSVVDGHTTGAEALVRWRHPEQGLLSPAEFIPLAEESGLILPLGRYVLEQACLQARRWKEELGTPLTVSVNLSVCQFSRPDLAEDIESILAQTGVDPDQICLEITESIAMDDLDRTEHVLRRLKTLGVRVAIDDFGTGYSSLAYLKNFPVDVIKIDKSFVDGLETDPVNSAIVSAVISLAHAIGATTVAEGVETERQFTRLRLQGCPLAQGFYLGRAVPPEQFEPAVKLPVDAIAVTQTATGPHLHIVS